MKMKPKSIIYMILTVIFAVFSYICVDRAINIKTKKNIYYQVDSNVFYKVKLLDSNIFTDDSLNMGGMYITNMVDDIQFTFNYDKNIKESINGYYRYNVLGNMIIYKDDVKNVVWEHEYTLMNNKVELLNKNDLKDILVNDTVILDYDYYKKVFDEFALNYGVNLSGYMELVFNVNEVLEFKDIKNEVIDNSILKVVVPLSEDTFRINILDNKDSNTSSYYKFSTRERVNYLFLVFGALFFSIMVAFLFLVIDGGMTVYNDSHVYSKELNSIINKYGDILVKVKRFYNKKKYNLIYVDNFNELMDVYNKIKSPITYREVMKDTETIFLITDGDNAWIYRMVNECKVKKKK